MSAIIPSFGSSGAESDLSFILSDLLNGMGDWLSQEPGSLNWIECLVNARGLAFDTQFIRLMANQLSPASASVYLLQWADIYSCGFLSSDSAQSAYIQSKQAQFGTPPTINNLRTYFQQQLSSSFIDLEWRPELQPLATSNPIVQIQQDGYAYQSPLSTVLVYCWQPRDNQDNLLMTSQSFNSLVDSYHSFIESWNPAYLSFQTYIMNNRGNQDGYGGGYNGQAYNNYLDGYNVISGTAGSTTITGINTVFSSYPDGERGDFVRATSLGYYPPLQVVDDAGILQTYSVLGVINNTDLLLTTPLINTITHRTYRTIGFVLDTPNLDGTSVFSS